MGRVFILCMGLLWPLGVQATDEASVPSYSDCFKLLRTQVNADALAQQKLTRPPTAKAAHGAVEGVPHEAQTSSLVAEAAPGPLTRHAQCKAMYFLTY